LGTMEALLVLNPETVQAWVEVGGPLVIFGLLFACGLGLPLPEDIPLMLAGFFAAQGKMNLAFVATLCWLGIIGGDCVLYSIARRYGMNITRIPFIGTHVTTERIVRAQHLFERYGVWIVAIGRMFAGIRGAMVIAAGVTRFNFVKFVIADGLAALVSGGLFLALGWWAGKWVGDLKQFREKMKPYEHWIMLGIGVAVVLVIVYFWWRKRKETTLSDVALEKAEQVAEKRGQHRRGANAAPANPPTTNS
jgi:membrane protein DedA with SNARE-associated domain